MDFIKSTSEKMNLWPVEHFFPPFFFPDQCCFSADLEKTGEKSVQLARGSFFRKYFLWNPYFSFLLRNYIMENRTSLGTDLISMNISWSYEDLELLENNYDFTISLIFTVVRSITLILGIIVHRAFYKLMKRIPGRAINQIIYPYMVIYL